MEQKQLAQVVRHYNNLFVIPFLKVYIALFNRTILQAR